MTDRRSPDDDSARSRRALITRLTVGAAAGAAFVYPSVLTFSHEWAQSAAGQRVDHSVASVDATGLHAAQIAALLQQES